MSAGDISKGYKLHPETIRKILIEELGTEAWWRINGVNRRNYLEDQKKGNSNEN